MVDKCVFGKKRIGFELESFATSSEAMLGVSSCAKPSLPLGRREKKRSRVWGREGNHNDVS